MAELFTERGSLRGLGEELCRWILGAKMDVFGAEAYTYEAGGDAAEVREALEEFEEPREG